jgi:hypothetical protein
MDPADELSQVLGRQGPEVVAVVDLRELVDPRMCAE